MRKIDDKLKAAIARLPAAEKDKLLFRLVAKDEKLVRKLVFELLEGGETRDERAAELRAQIEQNLPPKGDKNLSPGYLLLDLRYWNARITEHVQATRDKAGEVILPIFLLSEAFRRHREMLERFPERRSDTLAPYVVKRTASILQKAAKLHEDYFVEFRRDLNELLQFIRAFPPTARLAEAAGLPREWGF